MATSAKIAAIERATGRRWSQWLEYLDGIGAAELDHHTIATRLIAELDGMVDNLGWWAQATANAYEHHIGRRVPGQQPDGSFRVSVSKSTALDMTGLMRSWAAFAAADAAVAGLVAAEPRVSGTDRRLTWRVRGVDDTAITVIAEPKPNGTASLVVQHGDLASAEASGQAKAAWADIVSRFVAGTR
jgi:hypothetical protein